MTAPDHMTKPLENLLAQTGASIHGSVPLVARVGGLADTVIDANEMALAAGVATGFQFSPVTCTTLEVAIARVHSLWLDRAAWNNCRSSATFVSHGTSLRRSGKDWRAG